MSDISNLKPRKHKVSKENRPLNLIKKATFLSASTLTTPLSLSLFSFTHTHTHTFLLSLLSPNSCIFRASNRLNMQKARATQVEQFQTIKLENFPKWFKISVCFLHQKVSNIVLKKLRKVSFLIIFITEEKKAHYYGKGVFVCFVLKLSLKFWINTFLSRQQQEPGNFKN